MGRSYEGIYIYHDTVTNTAGATVTGGSNASAGWGVVIRNPGVLSNAGTINGIGQAGAFLGGGSVTNQGSIGGTYGIAIRGTPGTVVNSGTVTGLRESGVFLSGGNLTNAAGGSISGVTGVTVRDGAGALVNSGFIGGSGGAANYSVYLAQRLRATFDCQSRRGVLRVQVNGGNTIGSPASSARWSWAPPHSKARWRGSARNSRISHRQTVDTSASWAVNRSQRYRWRARRCSIR